MGVSLATVKRLEHGDPRVAIEIARPFSDSTRCFDFRYEAIQRAQTVWQRFVRWRTELIPAEAYAHTTPV